MLLELQKGIVYGPVQSRRLGRSLGINILPPGVKVCTFNCLYCQYGWTDFSNIKNVPFPPVQKIIDAVGKALESLPMPPAYVTFSGNGEPTLHPQFSKIVDGVTQLKDGYAPSAKTAILSNSSRVHDPSVREALGKLDVRIMKLDAGRARTFKTYNKPYPGIFFFDIIQGLCSLEDVTIQALFTGGRLGNFKVKHLSEWIQKLERIKPIDVQVYTLDRGCPSDAIVKREKSDLEQIKRKGELHGIPISVF